jgi:hypothetical protein
VNVVTSMFGQLKDIKESRSSGNTSMTRIGRSPKIRPMTRQGNCERCRYR